MMSRRKEAEERLKGWRVLAVAGIAIIAVLALAFVGLTRKSDPSVNISRVSPAAGDRGADIIRVEGNATGFPRFSNFFVYAVARPADGGPVGGTATVPRARPGDGSYTVDRNWYVSGAALLTTEGPWSTEIRIDRTEQRPLAVQAIITPGCPRGTSCYADPWRNMARFYTEGPSPDRHEVVTTPEEVDPDQH